MRCTKSVRCFVLASCASLIASVTWSCGGAPNAAMHAHHAEALDQNGFIASDHNRFFWKVEWLSGAPVAKQKASARLSFHNAEGSPAGKLTIKTIDVVMTCCQESPVQKPEATNEAGTTASERDVGNILPTKSGKWRLQVEAEVDGAEADTASWIFRAEKP